MIKEKYNTELTTEQNFILKQGFREGSLGFFLAKSSAIYTYQKYAKTKSESLPPFKRQGI